MESSTSFDLNGALQQWRAQLKYSDALRGQDIHELESHLRDAIADWQNRGLRENEAFWVACQRLGTPGQLCAEFGKINQQQVWLTRCIWMLAGSVGISLLGGFTSSLTSLLMVLGVSATSQDQLLPYPNLVGGLTLALHTAAFLGLVAWCWRSGAKAQGFLWRLARWAQARPWTAGATVAVLLVLNSFASFGVVLLQSRQFDVQFIGAFYRWRTYGSMLWYLLWPLALIWLLHQRRQRQQALA